MLFILLPFLSSSQKVAVNEYDRFVKQRMIQLEPVRISSSDKGNLFMTYNAVGSALYARFSGFGWGAFAIDEGQEMIFLFSNDSTIKINSTDVQTAEVNASFQNSYKHSYFVKLPDIKLMSEYEVVGIRKYGLGDHVDLNISRENAVKIKKLSAQFLDELKVANLMRNLQDININDISKHIGDSVRFCATVFNSRYFESVSNKPTILDVNNNYISQLNIIIWEQDRKKFSNAPESLYTKKQVCISGLVEFYNNMPQITIRNRDQITLKTPISLSEVSRFVGDSVTVSGKVATSRVITNTATSPTLLNMGAPYPEQLLTLVIENKDRESFAPAPEAYYLYKDITVTGKIQLYNGKPQIVVQSKNQIVERPDDVGKIIKQPEEIVQVVNKPEAASMDSSTAKLKGPGEKPARFPGGHEALLKFLQNNVECPQDELSMGEKKIVVASFLINIDGSASNIRITQPAGKDFDQEVIRVIKMMPKWEPQMRNGSAVPVTVTQHVTFVRAGGRS